METIKITSPDGREGVVEFEDGPITSVTGDVSLDDIAEDIRPLRPDSATGTINTVKAEACFVLRSAELVGWIVKWPEIDGDDENDGDYGCESDITLIVN
ncbi:hypothetical protein [Enterobacter hormaechei]|uniref:hypothetical protein n=1 Tax=Enterobacter hormaechei TaxID=158836 RepID=UPI0028766721|nr:hypothetical protein [Enterobacter hormaechei]MDR9909349.1 hypothetical protein [Enterobacter hormaechei subsp. steigerwaltii]